MAKTKDIEQVVARLSPDEWLIFRERRMASGHISDSSFVLQMIHEFFEGGCLNTPDNRLNNLESQIDKIQQLIEVKA